MKRRHFLKRLPAMVAVGVGVKEIEFKPDKKSAGLEYLPAMKPVNFEKISDRIYEITNGIGARSGVYIGDNEVVVIDSKMGEKTVVQIISGIRQITDKPLKYLINTHSDIDHTIGNVYFPKDITVIAHESCKKELMTPGRNSMPELWNTPENRPFLPSKTFKDKMVLNSGSANIELWYFGKGHTSSDIVVYFPDDKVAFIGDQAFTTKPQMIRPYKGGSSIEHVKTLQKMLNTIDAEKFIGGHVEITDREGIKAHIRNIQNMQEKVKTLVSEDKSLEEIQKLFEINEDDLVEVIFSEVWKGIK